MQNGTHIPRWLDALEQDELRFLKRFLLASGSLKDLAGQYDVSYPTIRNRLNDLIAKVEAADEAEEIGPLRANIRALVRADRLDVEIAQEILNAYSQEQKGKDHG